MIINLNKLDAIVFDFDGVLTNNSVLVNEDGKEWVTCNRSDGLAFDVFRKLNSNVYILSTEENSVVSARAKKLKVPVLQGVANKVDALKLLVAQYDLDLNKILYVGNDLNDLSAMRLCGYSVCPNDSHIKIKEIATYVLNTNGGGGVVREIIEDVLCEDVHKTLYPKEN